MEQSPGRSFQIFLSAGEASGDLHGSHLVQAIRRACPEARFSCMGGPLLERSGAQLVVHNGDLAVVGLFEVLKHLKSICKAFLRIRTHLISRRPDLVVLIDYPDFNFLLGRMAKAHGLRVFYYISPQVWAWRSGRVSSMKRFVDAMAVILPFEPQFYSRYGMDVRFVGHPLLDVLDEAPGEEEARLRYGGNGNSRTVGLLPGSRRSEIHQLLGLFCRTAVMIRDRLPECRFLLPVAPALDLESIEKQTAPFRLPLQIVSGDTYGVIRACDLLITASGTVTLEAAILGTPMIIANRVSDLTYHAGRHLIRVRHIGLPNLIAGRSIVPEFIQNEAHPDLLAQEAAGFLRQPERLARQRRELAKIRGSLGTPGVADRVANMVLEQVALGSRMGSG